MTHPPLLFQSERVITSGHAKPAVESADAMRLAQLFSAIRVPETKNRRGHRSAAALHSCLSTFFVGARG